MKTLVLGLGNELLGDDGVGIMAAETLRRDLNGRADVVASSLHGLALMEVLAGYQRAVIIDALQTASPHPGRVVKLDPKDMRPVEVPSPHYTGLPEMMALARELQLDFPEEIVILGVEIVPAREIKPGLSRPVEKALKEVIARTKDCLREWQQGEKLDVRS